MPDKTHYPIAFCRLHGIFEARGTVGMSGGAKVRMLAMGTNCPQCDGPSEILPGLYEADGDKLRILLDPSISLEALEALKKLLLAVQAGEITPEEAKKEAEKVRRGAGAFFDIAQWSDHEGHPIRIDNRGNCYYQRSKNRIPTVAKSDYSAACHRASDAFGPKERPPWFDSCCAS